MAKSAATYSCTKLEDEAMFDSLIEESENKLIFVDLHEDWCGPCDALQPTLNGVFQGYDQSDARIKVVSASIAKFGAHIQQSLPSDSSVKLDKNGCLPCFALYRHKQCVGVISGVDGPSIISQIQNNIPDKPAPVTGSD